MPSLSLLLPALCISCGRGFQFKAEIPVPKPTAQIAVNGCKRTRSCKVCGDDLRIPDGTYELLGGKTRFAYGPSSSLVDIRSLESSLNCRILSDRKVVKFCRMEHHISRTRNIQLGTLNYYRSIEHLSIRDSEEGHFKRQFTNTTSSSQLHTPADLNLFIGTEMMTGPGGLVLTPGATVAQVGIFDNVYLFCTSRLEHPSLDAAKQFDYDAFYEIEDPYRFGEAVRVRLEQELKKPIFMVIGDVEYRKEKKQEFKSLDDAVRAKDNEEWWRPLFIKNQSSSDHSGVSFEENQEFRMAFIVTDDEGNIVPVDENTRLIDASTLRV